VQETAEEFITRCKRDLPNRKVYAKDIGRGGRFVWRREAVTLRQQTNYPSKVFMVERLRLERVEGERLRPEGAQLGDCEYRVGYYVIARSGKWWWGQYAALIPEDDFGPLLKQARDEGTLLH
jgi:hypothetical protein